VANRIYISVDRRDRDGAMQISIGVEDEKGGGRGYRIAGPKYDGRGKTLLKHFITERDRAEIHSYLRLENTPADSVPTDGRARRDSRVPSGGSQPTPSELDDSRERPATHLLGDK
jgi:hypothetical protein